VGDESDIERPQLPKGALVNGEILITSYFDKNGKLKFSVASSGNMNLAQAIGLLVLGGVSIHETYIKEQPYDPDEMEEDDA
jgi:hypothetical protein